VGPRVDLQSVRLSSVRARRKHSQCTSAIAGALRSDFRHHLENHGPTVCRDSVPAPSRLSRPPDPFQQKSKVWPRWEGL